MFLRVKKNSDGREYLQLVDSFRLEGKVRQRVIGTLGRRDLLQSSGALDGLTASLGRFAQRAAVLTDHRAGRTEVLSTQVLGPGLVFARLWEQLGLPPLLGRLLKDRRYEFPVERAVFLTVLHRLCCPGSDRAAEHWRQDQWIPGGETLDLHHLYRAMAWLGEALPDGQQCSATLAGQTPRCTKDLIEEALFARRRNLFTGLSLAFFDTTSLYFEGAGGESIGQYGFSKDHRPDLKQMVVGAVLSDGGTPICCELWPGNRADVTTLLAVMGRLRQRFGVTQVCVVADRGMISDDTIRTLERDYPQARYLLGARLRSDHEVRDLALGWPGRYQEVPGPRQTSKDPSPLKVKEVRFHTENDEPRRYIVCHNEEQAAKDRADREAILAALEDQLKRGDKSLVGNKGYRKYLKAHGRRFQIDQQKVRDEARFDGKWVLRTNWDEADAAAVALRYKELWIVERAFRAVKSVLQTRPIYHKCDETIRGHVFCSFLALVLMKELQRRLEDSGYRLEWEQMLSDLHRLRQFTVRSGASRCQLRSPTEGVAGKVLQAMGLALGPSVQFLDSPGGTAREAKV